MSDRYMLTDSAIHTLSLDSLSGSLRWMQVRVPQKVMGRRSAKARQARRRHSGRVAGVLLAWDGILKERTECVT